MQLNARPATLGEVAFALNQCIEISTDAEKGYAVAAADVRDPALKALLFQKSQERAGFVVALQSALRTLGAYAENQGTAKGAAHRGWMDLRLAVEGQKDRIVIEEWVRGEQAAVNGYRRALARTPMQTLPDAIRVLVAGQYSAMVSDLDLARRRLAFLH